MLKRLWWSVQRSLRYKLLAIGLLPILLVMPATLGLALYWSERFTTEQLFRRVNSDLAVAEDAFLRLQQHYLDKLGSLAESYVFHTRYLQRDGDEVRALIRDLKERAQFDFIHLTDPLGVWLFETEPARSKPSILIQGALEGRAGSGIEVFSYSDILREGNGLPEKVVLPLIDTSGGAPADRRVEDRAMVLRLVYPVTNAEGKVVAVLDGGVLLSGNYRFVDAIRDLVYGPGSVPEGGSGTVTVLLDDVRISTNLRDGAQRRAVGTRMSEQVHLLAMQGAGRWVGRSFEVNGWHISAYSPIWDVHGQRVGMLHTAFLETPLRQSHRHAMLLLLGMLVVLMGISSWLVVRGTKSIFQPIEAMTAVVRATQAGQGLRSGPVAAADEIGELARQFDRMLDLLQERQRQIRRAAEELERKVNERTRELQQKNADLASTIRLLRETRQQLFVAEKLAALGELAAGVAHEINNPTAVILGNMDVIVAELGKAAAPVQTEIDLIVEQVYRIRSIVDHLLQYARKAECAGQLDRVDVNRVIAETLPLVQHELERKSVVLTARLQAQAMAELNPQDLKQVLVNLIVNAVHAVPVGGRIELLTDDWQDQGVTITVRDNGSGIQAEHLSRIFDPFFTTKQQQGTGLGLYVSYLLIRRYGGNITVESTPGQGSAFRLWLLSEAPMEEAVTQ